VAITQPQKRRLPNLTLGVFSGCKSLALVSVVNRVKPYLGSSIKQLTQWKGGWMELVAVKFALFCKRRGCREEKEVEGATFAQVTRAFNACVPRDEQGLPLYQDDD
jgi:hypothetical protein